MICRLMELAVSLAGTGTLKWTLTGVVQLQPVDADCRGVTSTYSFTAPNLRSVKRGSSAANRSTDVYAKPAELWHSWKEWHTVPGRPSLQCKGNGVNVCSYATRW
jgi:hypothetical protein